LVPTPDGGDDLVWVTGPHERLGGFGVVFADVMADDVLKIGDGLEDATPDAPAGDDGEEALDGIEPRC
jgi:hypothetical protein